MNSLSISKKKSYEQSIDSNRLVKNCLHDGCRCRDWSAEFKFWNPANDRVEFSTGFGREHFHSNLLVALDKDGDVLRYTFYMGDWDWHRLCRGMETQISFHAEKDMRQYDSIGAAIKDVPKMGKDDFIIACCLGHTAMLQAYCDEVVDGVQQFTIEWQILHYLPWQFYISKGTRKQLVSMLEEFDEHGIEPVETMARWKWRKMKGNT